MPFSKLLSDYKTEIELRQFCQATLKTVQELTKKNKALTEEVSHMQSLLVAAVPIVKPEGSSLLDIGEDDIEIAKMELKKLRERAYTKELTLEEAKRTDIYSKILQNKNKSSETPREREVKSVDLNNLLAIVEVPEKK